MSRGPALVEAQEVTLLDLVDRAVDHGVILAGDIKIAVAGPPGRASWRSTTGREAAWPSWRRVGASGSCSSPSRRCCGAQRR
jgi:hypothetical protein